jgi:hypothetical protein
MLHLKMISTPKVTRDRIRTLDQFVPLTSHPVVEVSSSCSTSGTRRVTLITNPMIRVFPLGMLKSSLRTSYGRPLDLVECYGISVSQITTDMIN